MKADFWVLGEEEFEKDQLRRRIGRKILGKNIFFISPENLILSKLLWHKESGSERQLEDVASVLRMQKKLDWKYLRKWAKAQSTLKILESLYVEQVKFQRAFLKYNHTPFRRLFILVNLRGFRGCYHRKCLVEDYFIP